MKIVAIECGKLAFAGLLAGCFIMAAAMPARAGLGGNLNSIEADATAMRGTMSSPAATEAALPAGAYSVKSFVTSSGVKVREYAAPSGAVFGVAWQGHRPPDLSVLLGSYYREYESVAALKTHRELNRAVTRGPNSVVIMAGHMGHMSGRAYVPSLAPAGVDPVAVVK